MRIKKSISRWEDSLFGGYERVIYNYPFIICPAGITYKYPRTDLMHYIASQLCKLFLLRVKQNGLVSTLLYGCSETEESSYNKDFMTYSTIRASVEKCLIAIITSDKETGSLFDYYREFIERTSFEIKVPYKKEIDEEGNESIPALDKNALTSELLSKMRKSGDIDNQDISELKNATIFYKSDETSQIHYTKEEIKLSDKLLQLLDISFESKADVIENLKMGKLSSHKIAEIPAGNTHVYYRIEEEQSTRPFSVCILADESGSMQQHHKDAMQHQLIKILYKTFSRILPLDKIYVYGHSGDFTPEVRIYNEPSFLKFDTTFTSQLANDFCENYDGPVIECIYDRIRKNNSDNIIFISISDGCPSGNDYGGSTAIREMKRVIEKCKRDGFVTAGVGLIYDGVRDIYEYNTVVTNMNHLIESVSKLVNRVVKSEFCS